MTETAARGRPRSADRTTAILDAAADLMREVGYDALRVQDVAERAGAGLATIYRRWSTKEELVAAAIRHRPMIEIEPTGDAREDLRAMFVAVATDLAKSGDLLAGFMAAAHANDSLGDAVCEEAATFRAAFAAALGPLIGESDPRLPTLVDLAPSLLMMRVGMLDETVEPEAFADELMALVDAVGR